MMTGHDDVLRRLGTEYAHGYGPAPIPCVIDEEVSDIVDFFYASDADDRQAMLAKMIAAHGFVLIAFAERMAARAIRENRPELITHGLAALRISANLVYFKEALPVVSLLYRSIQKLGLDARTVFGGAYGSEADDLGKVLDEFLCRSDEDRGIEAMGYIEGTDQDGFRYQRAW